MIATTGDRTAFDQAILPLQANLMHLALGLTHDAGDARDLVQDALERALREWARFTPGTNARAWVSAILSRLFIDRWRRRKRQPRFVDLDQLEATRSHWSNAANWAASPAHGDLAPQPWETVTEADLASAVAALPAKLRFVFEMAVTEGRSYQEISLAAGIPINTVGTRLLRARRQLRAALEDRLDLHTALAVDAAAVSIEAAVVEAPAPRARWRAAFASPAARPPRPTETDWPLPAWPGTSAAVASQVAI